MYWTQKDLGMIMDFNNTVKWDFKSEFFYLAGTVMAQVDELKLLSCCTFLFLFVVLTFAALTLWLAHDWVNPWIGLLYATCSVADNIPFYVKFKLLKNETDVYVLFTDSRIQVLVLKLTSQRELPPAFNG